jgi:hypothetical protein
MGMVGEKSVPFTGLKFYHDLKPGMKRPMIVPGGWLKCRRSISNLSSPEAKNGCRCA